LKNTSYSIKELKQKLEGIYSRYNHRRYVHPDPLEFLYSYDNIKDREIVGLVSSSLAYGRVTQILKSVEKILSKMGNSPYKYVLRSGTGFLKKDFFSFKHRFTRGEEMACLLSVARKLIKRYGSLNEAFLEGYDEKDCNVAPAILAFSEKINVLSGNSCCSLIPSHEGRSAFKRLNLYLRWMIRNNGVDPGGWQGIPVSKLLIPLDIHMWRISGILGLTSRKQADMKAVLEVTESLKKIDKNDPIRYDFALTRIGINRLGEDIIF